MRERKGKDDLWLNADLATNCGARKSGKRRKEKAIAYERQLAPLMARETKQKRRAGSNTIKPGAGEKQRTGNNGTMRLIDQVRGSATPLQCIQIK